MRALLLAWVLLLTSIAPSWAITEQSLVEPTILFAETRPANPDNYQLVGTDPISGQLAITNSARLGQSRMPSGAFRNFVGINYSTNTNSANYGVDLSAIAQVGVGIVRYFTTWNVTESSLGVYNFSNLDTFVMAAIHRKLKIILSINIYNSLYEGINNAGQVVSGGWVTPDTSGWIPLLNYIKALATHYALNSSIIYEITNEPNYTKVNYPPDTYRRMAAMVIRTIRDIDRNAAIVIPGMASYLVPSTSGTPNWGDQLLKSMQMSNQLNLFFSPTSNYAVNAWTQHQYDGTYSSGWDKNGQPLTPLVSSLEFDIRVSYIPLYTHAHRVLDTYSPANTIPFAIGERGFSSKCVRNRTYHRWGQCLVNGQYSPNAPDNEDIKAAMYVRQSLWDLYQGVPGVLPGFTINYVGVDNYSVGKGIIGLPAALALQSMLSALGDYSYVGVVLDDNKTGDVMLRFVNGPDNAWAIWNKLSGTFNVSGRVEIKSIPAMRVSVRDINNQTRILAVTNGSVQLDTGTYPLFVTY